MGAIVASRMNAFLVDATYEFISSGASRALPEGEGAADGQRRASRPQRPFQASTRPGFMMFCGSSAPLMARIKSSATAGL